MQGTVDGIKWSASGLPGSKQNPNNLVLPKYKIYDNKGIKNEQYSKNPLIQKFIIDCNKKYEAITYRNWNAQKRYMDTIYNYMIKTEKAKERKKKQNKRSKRERRDDLFEKFWKTYEPPKFLCGCSTILFTTYVSLWVHVNTVHRGSIPPGTIQGQCGKHQKYISYPQHILQFQDGD